MPKLSGPDLWYQGCPNLIYYSKLYGNKHPIKMKELIERQKELDDQIRETIEAIHALNHAIAYVKDNPEILDGTFKLFQENKTKKENKLEDLRYEWNMVNGAYNELEHKQKDVQH